MLYSSFSYHILFCYSSLKQDRYIQVIRLIQKLSIENIPTYNKALKKQNKTKQNEKTKQTKKTNTTIKQKQKKKNQTNQKTRKTKS